MEMEAFLAQSPDAARVREHFTAAVFSLGMASRCVTQPGPWFATTADLHGYLMSAAQQLEAAGALVLRA